MHGCKDLIFKGGNTDLKNSVSKTPGSNSAENIKENFISFTNNLYLFILLVLCTFRYRGDCQRYWRCVGGVVQVAYCSDGLFFNEVTEQCDFEANSKCDPSLPEDELQSEFIVYKK